MRRQVVGWTFAAGLGLTTAWGVSAGPVMAEVPDGAVTPVAVQQVSMPRPFTGLRDEAAMVLVGTALIGLAAAVRRAA